jgi:membrane protein YdbS with pleckstrin-like domain
MPLIDCPDCGKPVSSEAHACPNCGYPVAEKLARKPAVDEGSPAAQVVGPLAEVRPSWWGYFWHLFFFWLIVPPIIAYFRRNSTLLRIFPERITLARGLMTRCYRDYNPRDIRSIDIDQTFLQRMVGVGDLTIATAATADGEEEIKAIPDPMGVRDLILAQRGNR